MKNEQINLKVSQTILKDIVYVGLKDAVKTSLGIFKIMLPISLLMAILNNLGFVARLSDFLQPVASLFGLRGQAIFILLTGYLVNTYSAIALMISSDLCLREISILSSMILLSHTLPVELSIQKKAGGSIWILFLVRVGSSMITGFLLNAIFPASGELVYSRTPIVSSVESFSLLLILKSWFVENLVIVKIFIINIVINVSFKILLRFNIIDKLSNLFKHIMFLFGLAKEAAPYWLITNIIGLIYGSGILISANESRSLEKEEIRKLNISICSMHSVIQETANFLSLGVTLPVLIIPRFITSIISVWGYKLVLSVKRKL